MLYYSENSQDTNKLFKDVTDDIFIENDNISDKLENLKDGADRFEFNVNFNDTEIEKIYKEIRLYICAIENDPPEKYQWLNTVIEILSNYLFKAYAAGYNEAVTMAKLETKENTKSIKEYTEKLSGVILGQSAADLMKQLYGNSMRLF